MDKSIRWALVEALPTHFELQSLAASLCQRLAIQLVGKVQMGSVMALLLVQVEEMLEIVCDVQQNDRLWSVLVELGITEH